MLGEPGLPVMRSGVVGCIHKGEALLRCAERTIGGAAGPEARLALAAQLPRSLLKKKPALWWGTSVTKAWQR